MAVVRRQRESSVEGAVVRLALVRLGLASIKLTLRGQRGWADRMFLTQRAPAFVEFKRPGDPPRPLQVHRAAAMVDLGYDVLLGADDAEETLGWLRDIAVTRR